MPVAARTMAMTATRAIARGCRRRVSPPSVMPNRRSPARRVELHPWLLILRWRVGGRLCCLPPIAAFRGPRVASSPDRLAAKRWFAQRKRKGVARPGDREIDERSGQPAVGELRDAVRPGEFAALEDAEASLARHADNGRRRSLAGGPDRDGDSANVQAGDLQRDLGGGVDRAGPEIDPS